MGKLGENLIAAQGHAPFFRVEDASLAAPKLRLGDALRTAVRSLSGFQKEALISSARTGQTWRLVSDEGPYLNGHDAAPCPLAFMTSGMVSSYLNEIIALAEQRSIVFRSLRLVQNNYYTMQGSMLKRTMIGGAEPVELTVEIDSDVDEATLNNLVVDALSASPLNGLLSDLSDSLFKLAKNGQPIPTARVTELASELLPDPKGVFETVSPVVSDYELVSPIGLTPEKTVALGTSAGGSSLSDEQNRRLNLSAIATVNKDGMKDIEVRLYSPRGTSFRFLSAEDGRAPDANTLVSAGIAFCFMTQFGRFISMQNLDLPEYQILQDTHFSLGGASGGTGKAGSADPVETHVYLQTSETDSIAQEMLDISEQTCFLHALCRTELKTKLRVLKL